MRKSGLADSPLFQIPSKKVKESSTPPSASISIENKEGNRKPHIKKLVDTKEPCNHDTIKPRNHETTVSRYHDTMIGAVRKAVKEFGKEAATYRFTRDEKSALADAIYTYKNLGIKTSENEITRISINYILYDHKQNGKNSILKKVLKALND